jgi:tetratricopeptide (TPR) repeat protein
MTDGHCFISYSNADGLPFASQLANDLQGRHPNIKVWFDKNDMDAGEPWDTQIAEAIRACKCLVFVMTDDSVTDNSVCKDEWTWALKYKKPIIPLQFHPNADLPFRLNNLQYIEFARDFNSGISQLRDKITKLDSPKGILDQLKHRLADANRDLRRAKGKDKPRIQAEIVDLNKQIETQQRIVDNPQAAQEQTQKNIEAGLERERQPEKPIASKTSTKFINPPPGIAPTYFQDRQFETVEIIKFLQDDAQRLLTIVGRGGVGKTAMVCRLLRSLEGGQLPDDLDKTLGQIKIDGIVYLSESGSHRVNFANIFYDLCKFLPSDASQELDAVYKNPQGSTDSKMRALLEKFGSGLIVLLLDNFEPLVDTEAFTIHDSELDESLRAFLSGTHTAVKVVITTRTPPKPLNLLQPGRQRVLILDQGLESPYAENILREMDGDGRLGLKSAGAEVLNHARIKTRGFPRALEALFAILASDRYTMLEELLAMPLPENVVEALVGEAFNRLDTNAQKVMQALAVYNRPVTPAAVDYLLTPHLAAIDGAPILQRLANMHFARKESGRFYLHPVDREFALGLLPEGHYNDKVRSGSGIELLTYFGQKMVGKYPELRRNPETLKAQEVFQDIASSENPELIRDFANAIQNLDLDIKQKMQEPSNLDDDNFVTILDRTLQIPQVWTRYALTFRAASYFAQARKPLAEWKKMDDLAAQLAEFDLRYAIGDYDNATDLLISIDYDCLLSWGHCHLMIELHEKLQGKIVDKQLARVSVGNLGQAYKLIGNVQLAIECEEKALQMAKEAENRQAEGAWLGNLGVVYTDLGEMGKAVELLQKSITINNEVGDRHNESNDFTSLGDAFLSLEEYEKAQENYLQAIKIADEISHPLVQQMARRGLAEAFLVQNDLTNALITIEAGLLYDVLENNHNASVLHGIIALRQRDEITAHQAFTRAIAQADEILAPTPEYYSALDAKGLAYSGLAICEEKKYVVDAIEIFQKARKIAPHAGVVRSVLRLFDELVKCDEEGILKDVRKAVEGS